jgi:glutamyl-tRNA synthetase
VPEFGHTPLLLASDGRRLSKRDGDQCLSGILSRGYSPRDVVGGLAYLGGLLPEPAPAWPEELLPLFSWEKLPREDIPLPAGLFGLG